MIHRNAPLTFSIFCSDDDQLLKNMGYKQDLYRGVDGFMNFALGYSEVGALVSISSLVSFALMTGGPVTMVWGWIGASLMTMIVAYCMAEICSAYPTAGSVYHWSGQLAPKKYAPLASYWTGISNWLGNSAGDASFAFFFAQLLSAALPLSGLSELSNDDQVGVAIAVLLIWSLLNFFRIDSVGWLANLAAFIQIGTTIAIVASLLVMAPTLNSAQFVFFDWENDTGFSNHAYVACIGLLFPIWGITGKQ